MQGKFFTALYSFALHTAFLVELGLPFASFAQATPPAPLQMSNAQADVAIMAYYPARARAAGIPGKAFLTCGLTEKARLYGAPIGRSSAVLRLKDSQ
jgi:hypothetical protein